MTLSASIGQCTTTPVSGMAGFIFSAIKANPNNGMLPATFQDGTSTRLLFAAFIESIAKGVVMAITGSSVVYTPSGSAGVVLTGSIY